VRARILLYRLIILAGFLLFLPWVVYRTLLVEKRKEGLSQRLGASPRFEKPVIWCHAVSVGEVRAVQPMLFLLQQDNRAADRIVLSTVTMTGQDTARRECGFVRDIFYFPLDLPFVVGRALSRVKPCVYITTETEFWPEFFFNCFRTKTPVAVVNGRISDRSYKRYRRFRWFFRPFLSRVSLFLMQSEEDARRVRELGACPDMVKVTGNMKYDREPEPVTVPEAVREWARGGFLLVGGSTHAGEEDVILDAVDCHDGEEMLTALVPRHPERFEEVARLLEKRRIPFTRYSAVVEGDSVEGGVLLVDAMGVLDGFYSLADAAFVGGSLVPVGGHNLLEPAMHGVPVLTGPYTHNFRDIAAALQGNGGCAVVNNTSSLAEELNALIRDRDSRAAMGRSARKAYGSFGGASQRNINCLMDLLF
jgi:3-deoxy-D-manno-octulosonic-acid transferase